MRHITCIYNKKNTDCFLSEQNTEASGGCQPWFTNHDGRIGVWRGLTNRLPHLGNKALFRYFVICDATISALEGMRVIAKHFGLYPSFVFDESRSSELGLPMAVQGFDILWQALGLDVRLRVATKRNAQTTRIQRLIKQWSVRPISKYSIECSPTNSTSQSFTRKISP